MKNVIVITTVWITMSLNAFSQKETTWIGGTPGMKNEWYCPQNWNTSCVPDEFSNVIIPDVSTSSFAMPVLGPGNVEINSITIHPNTTLIVSKDATLIVFGPTYGNIQKQEGDKEFMVKNEDSMILKN